MAGLNKAALRAAFKRHGATIEQIIDWDRVADRPYSWRIVFTLNGRTESGLLTTGPSGELPVDAIAREFIALEASDATK